MQLRFIAILLITISGSISAQNIHRTACDGNLQRLDSMLQYTNLNIPDNRGRTVLHWAVGCNQHEIFDDLVDRGIGINKPDQDGFTSLYVAIQFKRDTLFDKLVSLQEDENWKANQGASLLKRSILDGNLFFVKKLIDLGVGIEILNDRGSTPLELAVKTGAEEISEWLISQGADESKIRTFVLQGEYMGQTPPALERAVFAPNFISTEEYEYGSVFNKTGTEFYYAIATSPNPMIKYTQLINGTWTQPETILSDEKFGYNDPFLSPDEKRLYFISKRNMDGTDAKFDHDIWYVEKEDKGWSEPMNAGPNINSEENEYYISFTKSGTMYFASNINASEDNKSDQDIYYSQMTNGEFQEAVRLGPSINTDNYEADVFVDPDESYLVFCSTRPDGLGRGDLYISFKNADGEWSEAVNMGESINTSGHELCPFVTADGKYLFYTSNQDIYWISTEIFEQYRK